MATLLFKNLILKLTLLAALLVSAMLLGRVQAQETADEAAKKHGLSFPIAELGNCTDLATCKAYCDSRDHQTECVNFAKKKGFYKEPELKGKEAQVLAAAKTELGCNSKEACMTICQKEENIEKCSNFASKHGLGGPPVGRGNPQLLTKAKEILGCNSEDSCKAVCENPTNQQKCSDFASQAGLGGGIRRVGPGGCNSEESCRAYCESHMDECRQFGGGQRGEGERRSGPGGCNSEASCQAYCEKNPAECGGQDGRGPGGLQDDFCRQNPQKCQRGSAGGPSNLTPQEYCQQNPDQCRDRRDMDAPRDATGSGQRPPQYNQQQYNSQPYNGQQYNSGQADQSQYNSGQYNPSPSSGQNDQPSSQPSSQVQGAQTEKTLWQRFLNWLGF